MSRQNRWLLAFFSTNDWRDPEKCPSNLLSWQERTADRQCGECNSAPIHSQIWIDKVAVDGCHTLYIQFQGSMGFSVPLFTPNPEWMVILSPSGCWLQCCNNTPRSFVLPISPDGWLYPDFISAENTPMLVHFVSCIPILFRKSCNDLYSSHYIHILLIYKLYVIPFHHVPSPLSDEAIGRSNSRWQGLSPHRVLQVSFLSLRREDGGLHQLSTTEGTDQGAMAGWWRGRHPMASMATWPHGTGKLLFRLERYPHGGIYLNLQLKVIYRGIKMYLGNSGLHIEVDQTQDFL